MTPRGAVLHTVGVRGDTTAAAMREYHRSLGWKDLGYHFVIRKDGTVERGRPLTQPGAHTKGANDTVGICVTGHGDYEPWTYRQWVSVLALLRTLGFGPGQVCGHREASNYFGADRTEKTCPGRLINLDEVRRELTTPSG